MIEQLKAIHPALPALTGLVLLFCVAVIASIITRAVLTRAVSSFTRRTRSDWDDAFARENVFSRTAQVVPAIIVYTGVRLVPELPELAVTLIRNVAMAYVILMVSRALSASLSAANRIYSRKAAARKKPIKGFIQLAQIAVYIVGAVLIVATLIERSPTLLLGGFGAMTAVLMLVFKDTILGLVASVQLTAQDMVRVGDWIEMPRFNADGDVIDVALHTITVQNWDKTITTIPTHTLISDSFRNWRGMSESGGRRIKRSLHIDLESVRVLTRDEVNRFRRFSLLREYVDRKEAELEEYRANLEEDDRDDVNLRRLTNIGTYRAYIANYLQNHPKVHQGMTMMVRQLAPGAEGLPIEIYAFTNTTSWADYEGIQSDIFDHVLSITSEFGLHLFQNPTGQDLRRAFGS
ncbi:MAG: mechanosensitive ion channel domain-containing protein [Woeseia sp.]